MANVRRTLGIGDRQVVVLPSAARTAAPDTQEFDLPAGVYGLVVCIDVTAIASTPSLTVTVAGVDRLSGKTFTLLASSALTATGTTVLKIAPGLTASDNAAASEVIPPVVRVSCAHGDSDSITYSIGAMIV